MNFLGKSGGLHDLCHGPLRRQIIVFSIPIMLCAALNTLYNAVDLLVIGRYGSPQSLAAVSTNSSLWNFMMMLFTGLSCGATILTAQFIGAGKTKDASKSVHTAIAVAIVGGIVFVPLALPLTRAIIRLMDVPPDVFDKSLLYLRVVLLSAPLQTITMFCTAVLRADGQTRIPTFYLIIAGTLNFAFNMLFVAGLGLDVLGVALGTVLSSAFPAVMLLRYLRARDGVCRIYFSKLRINTQMFKRLATLGIPAGIQGASFSLSNIVIQRTINSFGSDVMAGNAAAWAFESFSWVTLDAFAQAATTFVAQNYGAGNRKRMKCALLFCLEISFVAAVLQSSVFLGFDNSLLSAFVKEPTPSIINAGILRLWILMPPYFIAVWMNIMGCAVRSVGYSTTPMVTSLIGTCLLRVGWILWIFPHFPTLQCVFISYPVSWILTGLAHAIVFIRVMRVDSTGRV